MTKAASNSPSNYSRTFNNGLSTKQGQVCMVSGFCHGVNEIFTLLGCCAINAA